MELQQYEMRTVHNTRSALDDLVSLVRERSNHIESPERVSASTATYPAKVRPLSVFIYFDEAQSLAARPSGVSGKVPLDAFVQTLDMFRDRGAFTVLLSTELNIEHLPPPSSYSPSARFRNLDRYMHAPLTETPFDCFGSHKLEPLSLRADGVGKVEFMAQFGRPLRVVLSCLFLGVVR